MNILVTGAKGFVGKNLVCSLRNIMEGKDRTRNLRIHEIYEYDIDTAPNCWMATAKRLISFLTWRGSIVPKTRRSLWRAISVLPARCWIR